MAEEKISQSELARRLGMSPSGISHHVKGGRFKNSLSFKSNGAKLFAWPQAEKDFKAGSKGDIPKDVQSDATDYTSEELESLSVELGASGGDLQEMAANLPARELITRLTEFVKFKRTQMDFERESGKYVDIEEARGVITSEYARISTRLMNSARSMAERVIAVDDVEELREMLEDDFRTLLQELSEPDDICTNATAR